MTTRAIGDTRRIASLNDPELVRAEYASELGLLARRAGYRFAEGPSAHELTFDAVAKLAPRRVLDAGCGPGELAERIRRDLGADVVGVDLSPRMVGLARERGVDARVGDVEDLKLGSASFDCVVAASMLYHVPNVARALAELHRVLTVGGHLVAVTHYRDNLAEVRAFAGADQLEGGGFPGDEAVEILAHHFGLIDVRDVSGVIRFPDRDTLQAFADSLPLQGTASIPSGIEFPFVVRRRTVILVASKISE